MTANAWKEVSLVAVDIGNTRIKLAGYAPEALATDVPRPAGLLDLDTALPDFAALEAVLPDTTLHWSVGSVHRSAANQLSQRINQRRPNDSIQQLTHHHLPLAIEVEHPERVGIDRLLATWAADHLRGKDHPAIVVSIGSAITVNLLTAAGGFAGGAILPGLFMAAEALADKTDALPLVSRGLSGTPPSACGTNTEAAIASGLYWGAVGAVRELIARLGEGQVPPENLFFSGGDGERFAEEVDPRAVYRGDLVLLGVVLTAKQ